jgi:hypothetical protein
MYKPQSLLDHLQAAVPALRTSPDQLSILVRSGRVACAASASLSFEYRYTVQIVVLDFTAHPDVLVVPILAWLRDHQPEIADNPELRDKAFRFEAEFIDRQTLDLSIELDLTERVAVTRRPAVAGQADPATTAERWDIRHLGEPARIGVAPIAEHWQLFDRDTLVAEWDLPAERV